MSAQKRFISLRYWLQGKEFYTALEAMEFAAGFHTGVRKDGFTPEFDHQISIAHYVRTLPDLLYPEATIAAALLHDVPEDYQVSIEEIERLFGARIARAVYVLSKMIGGVKRDPATVLRELGEDAIASIVKPSDRGHNFNSMIGVFTPTKQLSYVDEGEEIIAAVKRARRRFPQQERAYENVKHLLTTQIRLVRAMHADA